MRLRGDEMKIDKYIVSYSGEAVIYASSPEEALEKYQQNDVVADERRTKYIERVYFAKERWHLCGEGKKEE